MTCLVLWCADEDGDTVDTGGGSKTVLPVPVPIFLPAPMAMYNAPTPYPLPMPLPIPVPCFVPTTRNSIAAIMKQLKVSVHTLLLSVFCLFRPRVHFGAVRIVPTPFPGRRL